MFPLGIGRNGHRDEYFIVIIWPAANEWRKGLGLSPRQFYLKLTTAVAPEGDKGIDTLLPGELDPNLPAGKLDRLALTLHMEHNFERAMQVSMAICLTNQDPERGFLRLADSASKLLLYKLAMLAYAAVYQRSANSKLQSYCVKRIIACAEHTEWGVLFTAVETHTLPRDLAADLCRPWQGELLHLIAKKSYNPVLCLEPRERMRIPGSLAPSVVPESDDFCVLPRFFRWLIPFQFALMSTPKSAKDIAALASPYIGIRHVLTLTAEEPLPAIWFSSGRISNTFLPIPNYHPPTVEQMDIIMRLFEDENNLPILVHCGGGRGRAGTVAACYLVAHGFSKPDHSRTHPLMSASEAIEAVRMLRPGSLETTQQVEFVGKWCSTLWKRGSLSPPPPVPEPPPCEPEIVGMADITKADLLILVGLPGSGKSWFSNALVARNPTAWIHTSQDEARSRSTCESQIGKTPVALRGGSTPRVILDRCNMSREDRRLWLNLAQWSVTPVCVHFDYRSELCTSRAQNRPWHPTLPPGGRVRNAVEQMQRMFVKPTLQEGFKTIVTVRSFEAVREVVLRLSPPVSLLKFPRTPHLLNLGAVTEDDLRLGLWVEEHREDLYCILDRDPSFPERYILYGEWLAATHSIPYDRLPDYFMAFDVYDRVTGTWMDRSAIEARLDVTRIHIVPTVYRGEMPNDEALKKMVHKRSMFYDGPVEGLYIKVESEGRVLSRGKIVRSDFIAGNEHWTKGQIRWNGIMIAQ
ncbi:ATP dependent DNA ligase [Punctularia strigosozonata HHB-11173 SS5]|uniref:ATP dependent DNA ligase n=1 Tax=Punctularia strigosozonata (strain HHB-11173) TaxID=741275 RepID=UPI00044170EF|nr:ATP dependent DNA ligase [Punctularia strigosozonata HHB-11173 SS5]EIN14290.1 ATP dependent DNA ligase [Punctularia strigosozonata HHB-11173 SS5]